MKHCRIVQLLYHMVRIGLGLQNTEWKKNSNFVVTYCTIET